MKNIKVIQELHNLGITGYHEVVYNPSYEELFQAETSHLRKGYEKGAVTESGAVAVKTGVFTGRSPKDRYIVKDDVTKDTIYWDDKVNFPTTQGVWSELKHLVLKQLSASKKLYVVDAFCGTNADTRLKVRFVMEVAWQAHFVTNMFIRPSIYELENFGEPDFIVMNGSKATNPNWKEHGLNSENFVLFNLTEKIQKVGAAIQVMKNMMAMYSEFAAANEQKLLQQYETASQRKQTTLDKQLKAGIITQEQYKKATLKNEKDIELKKAQLEYKAAKRQRTIQIAQTIGSTALGIMQSYAQLGPIAGSIAAAMVGVVGAVQLVTLMRQPLPEVPGAEEGFYPTIRKQDGKLFNARKRQQKTGIYDEPTLLVGEQGAGFPELVVTQKTARRIDPDISNAYMREIARVEGAQDGYYKNVKNTSASASTGSDDIMIKLISSIDSFNQTMQRIKDDGLDARIADSFDNGQKIDKMVDGYQKLYNKSKHG